MNPREKGFLLLTCRMGDGKRKVLTVPQMRLLAQCVAASDIPKESGELTKEHVMTLGYNRESARRIIELLSEEERLAWYLEQAKKESVIPVSRVSKDYPLILRRRLGLNSPGCLWLKGDPALLEMPKVSLVGSRELRPENEDFARLVGEQAAKQGYALVSGNAKGADRTAQDACLAAGGKVISVVADELTTKKADKNILYLSEDSFDLPFSTQRALSRNRVIHAMGQVVFVAQCTLEKGGTWDGTINNLKYNWSPVFCFSDGSAAAEELLRMGAEKVSLPQLRDYSALRPSMENFIDR